jgi:Spy/CpxP family protein refolding chaperone
MSRLLFCSLFLCVALPLGAEPLRRPPPGPPFFQLAEALQLSDAQLAPVRAILQTQQEQMRTLDQANRTQRQQLRVSTHSKLRAILSAEQMQKLNEFEKSHRPLPPEDEKNAPPPRGDRNPPSR